MILALSKQLHKVLLILSQLLLVLGVWLILIVVGLFLVPEGKSVQYFVLDFHGEIEFFFGTLRKTDTFDHLFTNILEFDSRTASIGETVDPVIDNSFVLFSIFVVLSWVVFDEEVIVALDISWGLALSEGGDHGFGP